jgi:hypothetical protein
MYCGQIVPCPAVNARRLSVPARHWLSAYPVSLSLSLLRSTCDPRQPLQSAIVFVSQTATRHDPKTVHLTPTDVGARAVDGTRTDCSFYSAQVFGSWTGRAGKTSASSQETSIPQSQLRGPVTRFPPCHAFRVLRSTGLERNARHVCGTLE